MTDSQFRNWVISLLRRGTFLWKPRSEAKKRAKVQTGVYKTSGNPKYGYQCQMCKEVFKSSEIQVDHISPVIGPEGFTTWDDYINKMFCDVDNLWALCKPCHDKKSKKEVEERKKYRKNQKKA